MSSIHEAPVFQLAYDLIKDAHLATKRFEKSEKYLLGERLKTTNLDLLLHIIEAGQQKRDWKIPAIDQALLASEKLKILIRLTYDMKQISERRYLIWQDKLQKTGRMLGGWRRSI
ncbi:MAG: four helix bundle protein [Patescibacteria group bacterium]